MQAIFVKYINLQCHICQKYLEATHFFIFIYKSITVAISQLQLHSREWTTRGKDRTIPVLALYQNSIFHFPNLNPNVNTNPNPTVRLTAVLNP